MYYKIPSAQPKDVDSVGHDYLTCGAWSQDDVDSVNDWRASHAYSMQSIYVTLKRYAKRIHGSFQIVQRIKRLPSIETKLKRMPTLALSKMQDIGGCRVIVSDIEQVEKFKSVLLNARWRHTLIKENDYIDHPKPDGYRSLHLIYRFHGSGSKQIYSGRRIEIQVRTKLQHLWATAVETVDVFTGQNIKTGGGESNWKRFFYLVSLLFALRERHETSPQRPDLIKELSQLCKEHNLLDALTGFAVSVEHVKGKKINKNSYYYLITLNFDKRRASIRGFHIKDLSNAMNQYSEMELSSYITVLVSAKSIHALRKAYPNYFLDVKEFLKEVKDELSTSCVFVGSAVD